MKKVKLDPFYTNFIDLLEILTRKIIKEKTFKMETMKDCSQLYRGSCIGGYYSLEKAINTLKSNFKLLGIDIKDEIAEKFEVCEKFANDNKQFSIFKAPNKEFYNFVPEVFVANRIY